MSRIGFCRDCGRTCLVGHCDECKELRILLTAIHKDRPLEPDGEATEAARREAIHRARVAMIPTTRSR